MEKKLKDAIMALPQMKERLKLLHVYAGEKYKMLDENISVSIRLTTKTVANQKEDDISMDLNNKLRELINKPL
jgi:hypothetical protein